MKITEVRLFLVAGDEEGRPSQIDTRGWVTQLRVANPMSIYPSYARERRSWMGLGQEHYAVEIHTDAGLVGCCANYYGGRLACEIVERHFARLLIGQDPFDIARLWDQMYRASLPYGLGALTGMALAGVDLALWDLLGKALEQPVYRLIGGATKPDGIPCYVTTHPDRAAAWRDRGFQGVKIAAPYGVESGREGLLGMERTVAELREAVGDGMEIMIDCYMSWDAPFAARLAERVRRYDVRWFEDPLPSGWNAADYARLREAISPIMVTNGNLEFHYKAFFDLLDHRASDVIQPELHWCGGLTPSLWIAAYAKRHDVPVVPHGPTVYPVHLTMATVNAPYAEFVAGGDGSEVRPMFELLLDAPLPVDGRFQLPADRPGFGVRLNHDRLAPFQPAGA
jgi:L-rhamnonate dehydratase